MVKTSQVCPQGHSLECNSCLAPTSSGWQSLLPQPTTDALLSVLWGAPRATMTTPNEKTFNIDLKNRKMFSDLLLAARDLSWKDSRKRPIS